MYVKAIGDAAGEVWKVLGAKGRVALTTLPKLLDHDGTLVQQGVGWLARPRHLRRVKKRILLNLRSFFRFNSVSDA